MFLKNNHLFVVLFKEVENKLNFETSEDVTITETFEKMGFKENLLRGIFAYGNIMTLLSRTILINVYS